jgi:hypothetical protein
MLLYYVSLELRYAKINALSHNTYNTSFYIKLNIYIFLTIIFLSNNANLFFIID